MSRRREPVAYRKAIRAASLPWNQHLEQRAAASTSKLDLPAACLNSRPSHAPFQPNSLRLSPAAPRLGPDALESPRVCPAEFPARPIQQHEIMIDLDRQEPLVGRPQCRRGKARLGRRRQRLVRNRRTSGRGRPLCVGRRNCPGW